jgi:hypothetical protein
MKLDNGSIMALIAVFIYMFLGFLFATYSYIERYSSGVGIPLEDVSEFEKSKVKPQYLIYNKNYL